MPCFISTLNEFYGDRLKGLDMHPDLYGYRTMLVDFGSN